MSPIDFCVICDSRKRHGKHLITFTASQHRLPINHFRPIRWVRLASQWGPSWSCRIPSTYCSRTRLSTHTAFEWHSFPRELTFVPQAQLSDTGSNWIWMLFLQRCHVTWLDRKTFWWNLDVGNVPHFGNISIQLQDAAGGWERSLNGSVSSHFSY